MVELLKLRFGEGALQNCEIMLKDMADSKRTNGLLAQRLDPSERYIDAIISSYLFWPSFRDEKLKLPEPMRQYVMCRLASQTQVVPLLTCGMCIVPYLPSDCSTSTMHNLQNSGRRES
jgi:hypothetical protein